MSLAAIEINDALKLYRIAEGTEHEESAYAELNAVIERVKQEQHADCCGGRCRFCPVWRSR